MSNLELHGTGLTPETVERVASAEAPPVRLARAARRRVDAARTVIDRIVAEGGTVYGVTTGFGALAEVPIPAERIEELQVNLIRSHAAGVGEPLSEAETRAVLLLRANVLALGHSGVRPEVIDLLLELLNRRVHPVIPQRGSVGASGDLAPLSHLALVLIGEGEAYFEGERLAGAVALERAGLKPLRLKAKEGLALNNGTQVQTAVGVLALRRAERALETAEVAGALSLEALRGSPDPFCELLMAVRPHAGQQRSAERLRALLAGSEIRESHRVGDPRVQDAYSLRCMPQVHGTVRQALGFIRQVLTVELNSATDNPLVFAETGEVLSGGNFHGQPVAFALDMLALGCANLGTISERRTARLVDADLSGLPAFLTSEPGVCSGLMMAQVTAAALTAELKLKAQPASADTISTDANKEDHVPMGMGAALKARDAVSLLETVLAIELLAAAQGVDFLRPLRAGKGVEQVHQRIRKVVPPLTQDRPLAADIETLAQLVCRGELAGLQPGERRRNRVP